MIPRSGCPIVNACLRFLQSEMRREGSTKSFYAEQYEAAQILLERAETLSDDPAIVKLRGFIALEFMLERGLQPLTLKCVGQMQPLSLESRSWSALLQLKKQLNATLDDVELTAGEARLGGTRISPDVVRTSAGSLTNQVHLLSLNSTKATIAVVLKTIDALRPYLRNDENTVSRVGCYVVECMQHSSMQYPVDVIEVANKMTEAEL